MRNAAGPFGRQSPKQARGHLKDHLHKRPDAAVALEGLADGSRTCITNLVIIEAGVASGMVVPLSAQGR